MTDYKTLSVEILLAGFFAVACLKAQARIAENGAAHLSDFFRLSGRIDRLRKSRWAWFALVAFMLVLRLQQQLPLITEFVAFTEFAIFMALPASTPGRVLRG